MNLLFLKWLGGFLWIIPLAIIVGIGLSYRAWRKEVKKGLKTTYYAFVIILTVCLIGSLIWMYIDK